jgi:YHS domain-containing protein
VTAAAAEVAPYWAPNPRLSLEPIMSLARRALVVLALVAGLAAAAPALADQSPVFAVDGVAIKGYDPVAYFTDKKPVKGSPAFSFDWMGAKWLFASAAHRDTFAAAPEKYAPRYGGYCAYGVSQGYAVKIEPDAWTVRDGKLYLNYDKSIQKTWEKDIPGYIATADKKWPGVLK